MASSPRMISVTAKPVGMWTIGFTDRLRFPRFPSKLEKRGNARLRPHAHRHHSKRGKIDINENMRRGFACGPKGSTSNHLTRKAPYKPAPAKAGGRPQVMAWCEENGIDFVFGLPGNAVLADAVEEVAGDIRTRRALEHKRCLRG